MIIFDTNKLRINKDEQIYYHTFNFNNEINSLNAKIERLKIEDSVGLYIPEIAIKELKKQVLSVFADDKRKLNESKKKLRPIIEQVDLVRIPDDFNISAKISEEIDKAIIRHKMIVLISPKDDKLVNMYNNITDRAIEKIAPFCGKSDSGFKDAVIWETILNQDYSSIDQIFFVTKDGGFTDSCAKEFKSKFKGKEFKILPDISAVIEELERIYREENDFIVKFAKSPEFREYIDDVLRSTEKIVIDDEEIELTGYDVLNYTAKIEMAPINKDNELYEITSEIRSKITTDETINLRIITYLTDTCEISHSVIIPDNDNYD